MGHIRIRLAVMNFLQFAVWGAYLTSMGTYLGRIGMGENIGLFYAMQGIVSLFMPALLGIIADRWIPAQKLLSISHIIAAAFMISAGYYGMVEGKDASFGCLFALYSVSVAFYMPTLALSNSVAYTSLEKVGLDTVKAFPPIRTLGTIGFICMMWTVDLLDLQDNYGQFFACGAVGILLGLYALTLPSCPVSKGGNSKSIVDALGLKAFLLFKQKRMAIFFIFSRNRNCSFGMFYPDIQTVSVFAPRNSDHPEWSRHFPGYMREICTIRFYQKAFESLIQRFNSQKIASTEVRHDTAPAMTETSCSAKVITSQSCFPERCCARVNNWFED